MKRVLAFVALFALGLAILLWVQSRSAPLPSQHEPTSPSTAPTQTPLTPFTDTHGTTAQGNLSGPLDTRYKPPETGKLRYHVTATNVALIGDGVFELTSPKALFYDDRGDGALETEA